MLTRLRRSTKAIALALVLCYFVVLPAQAQQPHYKFDPDWPKLPLPNKWWMMGVTGMYVDKDDHIWVLTRPERHQQHAELRGAEPAHRRMLHRAARHHRIRHPGERHQLLGCPARTRDDGGQRRVCLDRFGHGPQI